MSENIFAKIFRFAGFRKHPDSNEWVDTKGKVPHWVKVEIAKIKKRYSGTSSSLANKYWIIHGKRYKYRLEFVGQSGRMAIIHKKCI